MSDMTDENTVNEVRLAADSIEALAKRLGELLAAPQGEPATMPKKLTAAEISEQWGVSRHWVYEHADELGVYRLGSGPRPRMRFCAEEVAERLGPPSRRASVADWSLPPGLGGRSSLPLTLPQRRVRAMGDTRAIPGWHAPAQRTAFGGPPPAPGWSAPGGPQADLPAGGR